MSGRIHSIVDAGDIAMSSYFKTKQNLAIAFVFNGVGVPLAVTGVVGPVWATIAMITSVTTATLALLSVRAELV